MKRFGLFVCAALALVVGLKVMADATQNRADESRPGSTSTVEFSVSGDDFQRGESAAADALWAVCAATVPGEVSPRPAPVDGHWQVTISPAIGEHGAKRLLGCLEDLTLDRVTGDVVAVTNTR